MRRYASPFGNRLPALEQNLLKRRAMEMVLILFHAEDLKRAIIDPVRTSGHLAATLQNDPALDVLPEGTKSELKKATQKLIRDGILSKEEADEIRSLIDYRNVIAHEIQSLTIDLSNDRYIRQTLPFRSKDAPCYSPKALERLKFFNREITRRTWNRYAMTLDMSALEFGAAERAFEGEIRRLDRKIKTQAKARRSLVEKLKAECDLKGLGFDQELYPRDPGATYNNGRLTVRGVEIMFRLFDAGRSPQAISILMDVAPETAKRRHKEWMAAGGNARAIPDFAKLPTRKF